MAHQLLSRAVECDLGRAAADIRQGAQLANQSYALHVQQVAAALDILTECCGVCCCTYSAPWPVAGLELACQLDGSCKVQELIRASI
jgi:hypothetical protein